MLLHLAHEIFSLDNFCSLKLVVFLGQYRTGSVDGKILCIFAHKVEVIINFVSCNKQRRKTLSTLAITVTESWELSSSLPLFEVSLLWLIC